MITVNKIKSSDVAYGTVPAALTTLINLGTIVTYNHLIIMSTLDTSVTIKIGDNEIVIPANKNIAMDNVPYNGIISYKYNSAPGSGNLNIIYS